MPNVLLMMVRLDMGATCDLGNPSLDLRLLTRPPVHPGGATSLRPSVYECALGIDRSGEGRGHDVVWERSSRLCRFRADGRAS